MEHATGRVFVSAAPDVDLRQQSVHGPFRPADIRGGERFRCRVTNLAGQELLAVTLWRLSPYGIEVAATPPLALGGPGSKLGVELTLGSQHIKHQTEWVDAWREHGRDIVGLRFETRQKFFTEQAEQAPETRAEVRWQCHALFFPTGQATGTTRFSDHIRFRVLDISGTGMLVATSLRNRMLIPGMVLSARLTFLGSGTQAVALEVVHCRVKEDPSGLYFLLGLKFVAPSKKFLAAVGQYILVHGHHDKHLPTPALLKKSGFYIKSVSEAVEYDYVRNESEYHQVCQLRADAFNSVPNLKSKTTAERMADAYDKKSRILVARFRGKIVGTVRVMFPDKEDAFEDEAYCTFPDHLPPRNLIAESSRACTDVAFRGTDVFLNLLRYATLVTLQANRRYVIQGTYAGLVPIYERIGFKRLGVSFPHPVTPGETVYLLLIDVKSQVGGQINPVIWNAFVPHIENLLGTKEEGERGVWNRQKIRLYRGVAPLVTLLDEFRHFMTERRINKKRDRHRAETSRRGSP